MLDTAFGDGKSPAEVTYHTIASQIREIDPRALTPGSYDDVLTMIEFMRESCIAQHDELDRRQTVLDAREKSLDKREKELKTRSRAVEQILKSNRVGVARRIAGMFR
jgi:hypothetical protein